MLPGAHGAQVDEPGLTETFPEAHGVQSFDDTAPIKVEYNPRAHASQLVAPVLARYRPAEHHTQLLDTSAPTVVE